MPWAERSIVNIRREFVLRVLAKEAPVAELARQYGISRKTAYKWIGRFEQRGIEGLVDESRRPRTSPLETTSEMAQEIIRLRQSHSSWGARKLHHILTRVHGEGAPSAATISRVLERSGLVRRRRRRPSAKCTMPLHAPSPVVEAPNDLWTVDFKGWWRTQDRKRCDPLTVRDAFSRYVLDVRLVGDMTARTIRRAFDQIFDRCGMPKAIQSDNGQPFASPMGLAGLTKLSAWWVSLGIELIRSRPGCPQDNGGHERMHADIRREVQSTIAANIEEQQRLCDDWRTEFNHVRPHEALEMKTPAEIYRPSSRRAIVRAAGHPPDCQRRVVDDRGWVRYEMMHVYVATSLAGQTIGFRREGRTVTVWFYELPIGSFVYGLDQSVQPVPPAESENSSPTDAS
jgi:transposase InsO family protein